MRTSTTPAEGVAHLGDGDVLVEHPQPVARRVLEDRPQLVVGLAEHQEAGVLDDADLLLRDRLAPTGPEVGVVGTDVGDDRHGGVGDVGGVEPSEDPDLDHGDVDRQLGEPGERRCGEHLEVRRGHAGHVGDGGDLADDAAELVVVDQAARPAQPLVEDLQVGLA
ncbi:MAG: hypothetical protein R2699_17315 [Acidimicrobiales bacterium]